MERNLNLVGLVKHCLVCRAYFRMGGLMVKTELTDSQDSAVIAEFQICLTREEVVIIIIII